ncbi:MAG: HEAT repeat domain-containing protein, partial [Planctomycetia bacterium]|nr:HEAT repeat domain-containing protein [Planctomycetia bacterium]
MSEFLSQEGSLFVNTLKKLSLGVLASGLLIVGTTFAQQGSLKQPIPMRVAKQIERLSSPDVRDRRGAALALGEMGQMATAAVGKLIAALRDSEPRVRDVAAWALGLIGDVRAIGPLIASLKDEDGFVRSDAAEALGVINDKRAVEPLIAALKDEWRRVRHSSALALGQIKDPRAVGPLITILTDEKAGGFGEADALAEIGSPAVNPLIAILKDEKETFKAFHVVLTVIQQV